MHELIFLTATALTVSVDSFLCGFSLAARCKAMRTAERLSVILGVAGVVTLLCAVGAAVGSRLGELLASYAEKVGGWVLIAIGALQLLSPLWEKIVRRSPQRDESEQRGGLIATAVSIGVGIGSDGAMASVTLAAMGYPPVLPVAMVATCHLLLIALGIRLAECRLVKNLRVACACAPLLLMALGVWKLLG